MLIEIKIELGVMVHLGGRGSHGDRAGLTRSLGNSLHCALPLQLTDAVPGKPLSPLSSNTAVALDVLLIICTSRNVFSRCRNHIDISGSIVRNSEKLENT